MDIFWDWPWFSIGPDPLKDCLGFLRFFPPFPPCFRFSGFAPGFDLGFGLASPGDKLLAAATGPLGYASNVSITPEDSYGHVQSFSEGRALRAARSAVGAAVGANQLQ